MRWAAACALAGAAGLVAIALGVAPVRTWFGPAIGLLLSVAWLCVVAGFYVSDEPLPLKSGEVLTPDSDPAWYGINFMVLFGMGAVALLACMLLVLKAVLR